jgi:ribonuclease HII
MQCHGTRCLWYSNCPIEKLFNIDACIRTWFAEGVDEQTHFLKTIRHQLSRVPSAVDSPLPPLTHVTIDSFDSDPIRLQERFQKDFPTLTVTCSTKADCQVVSVAAAAIVAKTTRDRLVADLRDKLQSTSHIALVYASLDCWPYVDLVLIVYCC